jgi:hypothetical protein
MACVRIGRKLWKKFKMAIKLHQGFMMSPSLFNNFIDLSLLQIVREFHYSTVMEQGVSLTCDCDGNCLLYQILYVDDRALVSEAECKFKLQSSQ